MSQQQQIIPSHTRYFSWFVLVVAVCCRPLSSSFPSATSFGDVTWFNPFLVTE